MHKLYEVKDMLIDELGEYADKGKLSRDDAMNIKYLASGADHICNVIEVCEDEEYSGDWNNMGNGMTGRSYRGRSYARGRGSNARRDSMGRYSSRGYSRDGYSGDMDEETKHDIKRLVEKLDSM